MKNLIFCLLIISLWSFNLSAQDYKTHRVKGGETIESISRTYMVTPFDILALNPDAKTNLDPGTLLIIPKSRVAENPTTSTVQEVGSFKKHKVKRKETLYSISRKYNVSVDDIKKYNRRLYSENLRKGDRIQIPVFRTVTVTNTLENTLKEYTVLPKEGKWRVAYKFGITVEELDRINPGLADTLQVGQKINVPNLADNEIKPIDDTYNYYTVLPKEGFYRLKLKLGLDQETLENLNPELKEGGLKEGMVLKVPKGIEGGVEMGYAAKTNLINRIKNYDTKRIAVMLPFRLHRIDLDSISEARDMIQKDSYMSISLDFHSGVLMALDSAKQHGISTSLDVFDTQARISQVSNILDENDFEDYDAVIGPFTADNFDRAATRLRRSNVPILAAVTKPKQLYANVYQTVPSESYLRDQIIQFVQQDSLPKHLIVIADSENRSTSDLIKNRLSGVTQIFSRKDKNGKDANYILVDDLENVMKEGRNIVFLETANEGFVSNVTSMLSALNTPGKRIILMTTDKNRAFETGNISNYDLSSLEFHFPSVNRTSTSSTARSFFDAYKDKYGSEPNRYAIRGFDLTLDLLLRLASGDDLYEISDSDISTEYVENKFRYGKKMFGGYYNESSYILKFQDLRIIEVRQ